MADQERFVKGNGELKTRNANGTTYVYDSEWTYDRELKKVIERHLRLRGKILPNETEVIPTRPKKPNGQGPRALARERKEQRLARGAAAEPNSAGQPSHPAEMDASKDAPTPGGALSPKEAPQAAADSSGGFLPEADPVPKRTIEAEDSQGNPTLPESGSSSRDAEHVSDASMRNPLDFMGNDLGTKPVLMGLLEWAGKESGIDEDLRESMFQGDAEKTIDAARYLLATEGRTMDEANLWFATHSAAYAGGHGEDTYCDLCRLIGADENIRETFFRLRSARFAGAGNRVVYDTSRIATYSDQSLARFGHGYEEDGLRSIKYTSLFAQSTDGEEEPVSFRTVPGNITDVGTFRNMLLHLHSLGGSGMRIVLDNGFWSADNLRLLVATHSDFIIRALPAIEWIQPVVDELLPQLQKLDLTKLVLPKEGTPDSCGADTDSTAVYVDGRIVQHTFKPTPGTPEIPGCLMKDGAALKGGVTADVHVHVCLNPAKRAQEVSRKNRQVADVLDAVRRRGSLKGLSADDKKLADKYLLIDTDEETKAITGVQLNEEALRHDLRYKGVFVLVAGVEDDSAKAVRYYRKREHVEDDYHWYKADEDGSRPRVHSAIQLDGRMFVQFAALCYDEFLRHRVAAVMGACKQKMEALIKNGRKSIAQDLDIRVLHWLEKISFHGILDWFDAYRVPYGACSKHSADARWAPEITERDRRFLELLAVPSLALLPEKS